MFPRESIRSGFQRSKKNSHVTCSALLTVAAVAQDSRTWMLRANKIQGETTDTIIGPARFLCRLDKSSEWSPSCFDGALTLRTVVSTSRSPTSPKRSGLIRKRPSHSRPGPCLLFQEGLRALDFDGAIRLDPKALLAFACRGDVYSAQKNYAHAIADYTEAI